jgi:hypothetical protein
MVTILPHTEGAAFLFHANGFDVCAEVADGLGALRNHIISSGFGHTWIVDAGHEWAGRCQRAFEPHA